MQAAWSWGNRRMVKYLAIHSSCSLWTIIYPIL